MIRTTQDLNKKMLETINLQDRILINDWESPLTVVGISDNYIVLYDFEYPHDHTIICKNKRTEGTHNYIRQGTYYCGPDDCVFGYISKKFKYEPQYNFTNPKWVQDYLSALESGEIHISERHGCTIDSIKVWRDLETEEELEI